MYAYMGVHIQPFFGKGLLAACIDRHTLAPMLRDNSCTPPLLVITHTLYSAGVLVYGYRGRGFRPDLCGKLKVLSYVS